MAGISGRKKEFDSYRNFGIGLNLGSEANEVSVFHPMRRSIKDDGLLELEDDGSLNAERTTRNFVAMSVSSSG